MVNPKIIMFFLAIVILISNVSATTFIVCPSGCDFSSIQTAVDAADPGDTVKVFNGTYNENIVINKALALLGESRDTTIIDGGEKGDVVLITKNNINFSGFKVINSGLNPSGLPYLGVRLLSVNNSTISNNNVSNNDHGIGLWTYSNNNLIEDNIAFYNNAGIVIADHSSYNMIRKNNASFNFYHGINPYLNSNENTIIDNKVLNNGYYGITPSSAHNNIITENLVSGNAYGIYTYSYFSQSSGNLIYRNNIIGNINQAYDDSGLNFWNNSTLGNHWSNFDEPIEGCNDLNNNGICDSSFSIPISSIDHYPLVRGIPPTNAHLTFLVTDKNTGLPISGASVQSQNDFKGETDKTGIVTFDVPFGDYKYHMMMKHYTKVMDIVSVTGDIIEYVELMSKK
jgi:parallel beta-helix repeat protein